MTQILGQQLRFWSECPPSEQADPGPWIMTHQHSLPLMSHFPGPGAALRPPGSEPRNPHTFGVIVIPTPMTKLRPREVRGHAQSCTATTWLGAWPMESEKPGFKFRL